MIRTEGIVIPDSMLFVLCIILNYKDDFEKMHHGETITLEEMSPDPLDSNITTSRTRQHGGVIGGEKVKFNIRDCLSK